MRPPTAPVSVATRCARGAVAAAALAACGLPDGTIDLLPPDDAGTSASAGSSAASSSSASSGGAGGAGGCSFNLECEPPTPMCDRPSGECVPCPEGLVECDGECVDTENDPANCGMCGQSCAHTQWCHASRCHCLPGTDASCDGSCRDLSSDPDYCGSCTHACAPGESCEASSCSLDPCSAGLTACPQPDGTTACVNLALGYPRCGSCDVICDPTEICAAGTCRPYLPTTPCASCPCDDICLAALGPDSVCCDGLYGSTVSVCVGGDHCP